jgi:hypothetical protein
MGAHPIDRHRRLEHRRGPQPDIGSVRRALPPITGCVKAIGQLFKLICCMAFFAAGALAGGYEAAVLWTMSTGFFLLALGY